MITTNEVPKVLDLLFSDQKSLLEIHRHLSSKGNQPHDEWFEYSRAVTSDDPFGNNIVFQLWNFRSTSDTERKRQKEKVIEFLRALLPLEHKILILGWLFREIYESVPPYKK